MIVVGIVFASARATGRRAAAGSDLMEIFR
jgi:hypothetical protein